MELNALKDSARIILPICAWRKKIRDDTGYWNVLENDIAEHSRADFSHSICPDCMQAFGVDANGRNRNGSD